MGSDVPSRDIGEASEVLSVKTIAIGSKSSWVLEVRPEHLANHFKDPALPAVLATPILIMVMENAALDAIRDRLDPGETAVGTRIDIRHLSPTPVGMRVVGEAVVTAVEGRRVVFHVSAVDESGQIGAGVHERLILDMQRITDELEAKRRARAYLQRVVGETA